MFNYRAWHKLHNRHYKVLELNLDSRLVIFKSDKPNIMKEVLRFDDVILEPGTGINDKTGREMFAGDIIEVFGERFEVKWFSRFATFGLIEENGVHTHKLYIDNSRNYKIIGHIHEER